MHPGAYAYVRSVAPSRPPGPVVEIGGLEVYGGGVRSLFDGSPYTSIDVVPGPGVDVVSDGASYVPPEPPACVVCCEVLEHAENAVAVCLNAWRILRPGGLFIVTAAGVGREPHSAVDGEAVRPGEYYRNVDKASLEAWLHPFSDVAVIRGPGGDRFARPNGDIYARAIK